MRIVYSKNNKEEIWVCLERRQTEYPEMPEDYCTWDEGYEPYDIWVQVGCVQAQSTSHQDILRAVTGVLYCIEFDTNGLGPVPKFRLSS